ncbi:hypothetical protein U9M48_015785 [Paspalum notatum var. saurae]|uniref:Uncharacterized protein n=1 Tax=Paspalum notatum var. saurae TaxID=547442 RepID=A0AAQ3T607_PASNO
MLFDKGFLAMGNGSISFGFCFFLVLIGWSALGVMVESYGFMLFRLWLLANCCRLPAKESLLLYITPSFCDLADHSVQRKTGPV